jgi:hypothetical protein
MVKGEDDEPGWIASAEFPHDVGRVDAARGRTRADDLAGLFPLVVVPPRSRCAEAFSETTVWLRDVP